MKSKGIKMEMTTAYHQEANGQAERMVQTLKTYLRHYVNQSQSNWTDLLPMAQLAINNHESQATGKTPYFVNHGRYPRMNEEPLGQRCSTEVATDMNKIYRELRDHLTTRNGKAESHRNKRRRDGPQLKKGDRVYLSTKNLRTKKPSRTLDAKRVGPFLIRAPRGPVNYELELPGGTRIHRVFHVSLLTPADQSTPLQSTFEYEWDDKEEFEVESILRHRREGNQLKYLIKWKGYPHSQNTWEATQNLANCSLLPQYQRAHPLIAQPQGQRRR